MYDISSGFRQLMALMMVGKWMNQPDLIAVPGPAQKGRKQSTMLAEYQSTSLKDLMAVRMP
jgi:hypothetical protein